MNSNIKYDIKINVLKKEYFLNLSRPLTNIEKEILICAYQPILGLEAISLYKFFIYKNQQNLNNEKVFKKEIICFCNIEEIKLQTLIKILIKYKLLEIINVNYNSIKLNIKIPILITELLKDKEFYNELISKVSLEMFEKKYLKLSNNNNDNNENNDDFEININGLFEPTKFMKKTKYIPKLNEYNMYQELIFKHMVPIESLKIVIEYSLFKNGGKRLSINYFKKIIEDCFEQDILFNISKLKEYFIKIYENTNINVNLKFKNIPEWLKNQKNNFNFLIYKNKLMKKKNDTINNKINNFISSIIKKY